MTAITDQQGMARIPGWAVSGVVCLASYLIGLVFTCRGGT